MGHGILVDIQSLAEPLTEKVFSDLLKFLVSPIAKRAVSAVLAATEIDRSILFGSVWGWSKTTPLVATITEWLSCAFPT